MAFETSNIPSLAADIPTAYAFRDEDFRMGKDVSNDQLAVIRIEGMHCHRCEQAIQRALLKNPGVHEVEVDFNSGQASVLYRKEGVTVKQLMDSVVHAGYKPTGFTQSHADQASAS